MPVTTEESLSLLNVDHIIMRVCYMYTIKGEGVAKEGIMGWDGIGYKSSNQNKWENTNNMALFVAQ